MKLKYVIWHSTQGEIMYLTCRVTLPRHGGHANLGWKLLAVCHHGSCHKHCDKGYIFFISHPTSCEYMFEWLCQFMDESSSW